MERFEGTWVSTATGNPNDLAVYNEDIIKINGLPCAFSHMFIIYIAKYDALIYKLAYRKYLLDTWYWITTDGLKVSDDNVLYWFMVPHNSCISPVRII